MLKKSRRSTSRDIPASSYEEGHRRAPQTLESPFDSGRSAKDSSSRDQEMVKVIEGVGMSETAEEDLAEIIEATFLTKYPEW